MAGCADDLRNRKLFDCGAGEAVISYSVADVILTRDGDDVDFESVVDHAYLLFYASDASIRTDVPVAAVRAENDPDHLGHLKFKMPLTLNSNTDYQLLAIANADSYTPSGFESYGGYLEAWCKNHTLTDYSPLQFFYGSQIKPGSVANLPMCGEVKDGGIFRFSADNGTYKIPSSLSFRRKVARIDIANIVADRFNVESILLCNWRDAVDVYPSEDIASNRLGSIHAVLSEKNASEDEFILMPGADNDGIQRLNEEIYCFPSVSYESFLGDKESTALIIKAKYGQDANSSYYRINVGSNGNLSEVKANTKYLITIQSVKGSGAPTPEEAYAAKESQIVLSIVEDWDLDGSNFAMDENGNFIVVSSSRIDFNGDDLEKREVKVLTSKGIDWTATYIPDNEYSSDAFIVSNLSDSSFVIGPADTNTDTDPYLGKCNVTAQTPDGNVLHVSISLAQQSVPYTPEIPEDMDFTIIPVDGKRVKIDHKAKTIEIDAFDPDCFNSFIDIPFWVYNKSDNPKEIISVNFNPSYPSEWPMVGNVSLEKSDDYCYCSNSFSTSAVYSKSRDKEVLARDIEYGANVNQNGKFYISVGAMAPDDPPIKKVIRIYNNKTYEYYDYSLSITSGPVIIDDVILTDTKGQNWLIFDRNIQDQSVENFHEYIGVRDDGSKYQAYNYTSMVNSSIAIPSKYKNSKESFNESMHSLYCGQSVKFSDKNKLHSTEEEISSTIRYSWLNKYKYLDIQNCTSPFYDSSIFNKWNYPSEEILKLSAEKMRASKLRMFLVSDVPVKDGKNKIPVCCYWPFKGYEMENVNFNQNADYFKNHYAGYFAADESGTLSRLIYFFCEKDRIKTLESDNSAYYGLSRLVRPLDQTELNSYKQNYLGYGSQPFKLKLCHPDTYGSNGWLQY